MNISDPHATRLDPQPHARTATTVATQEVPDSRPKAADTNSTGQSAETKAPRARHQANVDGLQTPADMLGVIVDIKA